MADKEAKIRFSAETQEFTEGIATMTKEMGTLRSELRLNQAQMDGASNKTALLKERTEILAKEQKAAQEKTALLNEKLEKTKEIYGEDSDEVRKYQNQLNQAKTVEQRIKNEIDATNKELKEQQNQASKVGKSMQEMGDKISNVGEGMTKTVTASVAAIGAASLAAFSEMDEGYDTIAKKTGATGDKLKDLQSSADAVFKSMPTAMDATGQAIGEVNTRFHATGEELESLSTDFLQFAEINDTDVTNSVGDINKIMQAWNVSSDKTSSLLGIITKKAQNTGISVDTLMEAVLNNNATFKEMGLSIEESINLMASFEQNGINSSTAITGLKKAVKSYTDEGMTMEEGLSATIESIKNATSETEALSIAQEIFGARGATEMVNAIKEGRFSVNDLSESMNKYGSVVSDTYEATLDPIDKSKVALNNLKLAGEELGETVQEVLEPAFEEATEGIETFTEWFSELDDGTKKGIVTFAGFAAALGPCLMVIGKGVSLAGAFTSALSTLGGAGAAAGAGTAAVGAGASAALGPIALAIAAMVALGVAFAALYNKSEPFRDTVNSALSEVKETFGDLQEAAGSKFEKIKVSALNFWQAIQPIVKALGTILSVYFVWVISYVMGYFRAITSAIGPLIDAFSNLLDYWSYMFKAFDALISGDFAGAWSYFQLAIDSGIQYVKNLLLAGWNFAGGFFKGVFGTWGDFLGSAKDKFFGWITGIVTRSVAAKVAIIKTAAELGASILAKLTAPLVTARNTAKKEIDKIKSFFNIKLKFNGIKMPHVKASWETSGAMATVAKALGMQGVPKFAIEWYAKGGVLTKPTLFGMNGGKFLGGGEAGPEAVAPIDTLQRYVFEAVNAAETIDYEKLGTKVAEAMEKVDTTIELNGRELGRTVRKVTA